jgi:acetyl esterase
LDQNDVEYSRADGKALLLDLHVPAGSGPFPTAIIVHGGGFNMGNKRTYVTPLFDLLTGAGFAWFTIDYRLAPENKFPAPAEDVEAAIRWVHANAKKYRVDTKRIAIMGESAGGFLVGYVGTHLTQSTQVAAVVDFYGPADLAAMEQQRKANPERFDLAKMQSHAQRTGDFFGVQSLDATAKAARQRALSPLYAAHAGMPPFLLIHGDADEQVPYQQSPSFCEAIKKAGSACTLLTIPGGRHGMGNWEKDTAAPAWKAELVRWLRTTLLTAGR